jgi:hypothetical protein
VTETSNPSNRETASHASIQERDRGNDGALEATSWSPLEFDGVHVLTAGPQGNVAIPGLALTIDSSGIILSKPDGTTVWFSAWHDVLELSTHERTRLDDGSTGLVLMVTTTAHRAHRFVVPTPDPRMLDAEITSIARQLGVEAPGSEEPASIPMVVRLVLAATAVVGIVLLLAAGHVIHL